MVTLVCNPTSFTLNEAEINSVVDMMQASGAIIEDVELLHPEQAVDIYFAVLPIDEMRTLMHALLDAVPVDFCVQPALGRKKKLLLSDMDSTMIHQECVDELAAHVGQKEVVSDITERAMNGEIDFPTALRERVALLKGISEAVVEDTYQARITHMEGAAILLATMKASDAHCVLVSGGFTAFTEKVARDLGFDANEANILEMEHGVLTGTVKEPILNKTAKVNALHFYQEEQGAKDYETITVGDGANDVPMLKAAGLGVAFRAKPAVQQEIAAHGGAIVNHADLTALLYFQGYKYEEFARP